MPTLAAALATLLVLTASAAEARTSFTPPVGAGVGQEVSCVVQNVGGEARTVGVTIHSSSGEVLAFSPDVQVQPGEVFAAAGFGLPGFGVYCSFEGLSRTVRGSIALQQGDQTLLVLPAGK